jgi:hypothetical protein
MPETAFCAGQTELRLQARGLGVPSKRRDFCSRRASRGGKLFCEARSGFAGP